MRYLRPPWWMLVVAASFISLHAFIPYLVIWGPADPEGLAAAFEQGTLRVRAIAANSPLAKAGLMAGDRVTAISRQPVRNIHDWRIVLANLEVGQPQIWDITRGGERLEAVMITERASWRNRLAHGYVFYSLLALSCFALGLFIAFRRPGDLVARIGAWFIMTSSIAFGLPNGWAVPWRMVPAAAQWLLWIPEVSRFVIVGIFLTFFAIFPCRLFHARWPWVAIWAPVLATLPWRISIFSGTIYRPGQVLNVPAWLSPFEFVRTTVYLAVAVVMLVIAYRRLANLNERRRVRVVMMGTAISLISAIPIAWQVTFRGYGFSSFSALFISFLFPATLACPLAFVYAILRHRILDMQLIIRQGLQYALARGAVLGIVPLLGAALILDLALNSQEPLAHIMQVRGWIYAALGGVALIAYWQRKPWLETLDRRFFRERYDAQRLLRDVIQEIRSAESFGRVAPRVVARIESSLHPEFVSLMVHSPDDPTYHTLASVPANHAFPALAADSKIVSLVRVLGKPLETLLADSGWLDRRLPQEEIDLVRGARIDLLVPIAATAGRPEALLALGIKRSEEPYTREDQDLLEAIAASLAMLFEQAHLSLGHPADLYMDKTDRSAELWRVIEPIVGQALKLDPDKRAAFIEESCEGDDLLRNRVESQLARRSQADGILDIPAIPRVPPGPAKAQNGHIAEALVGRTLVHYQIISKIGAGGMGHVYLARDTRLERLVALKTLPVDLFSDPDSQRRFAREAKAASALNHPNIATVHDIGEAGGIHFLVMEYVEGQTLKDRIKSGAHDAGTIIDIGIQAADALYSAHQKGIVHRDIKPGNLMLTPEGRLKVLDFGLAKRVQQEGESQSTAFQTTPGLILGTVEYMSPEQALGHDVDQRTDLFSLGVVLYKLATGRTPFHGESTTEIIAQILHAEPKPITSLNANIPSSLAAIIRKCLEKRPEARFQNALELREALAGISRSDGADHRTPAAHP